MSERKPTKVTELEGVVMDCVWDMTEATVRDVHLRLQPTRPMAYNTVLTVMRILRDKGLLTSRREGRRDVYRPVVSRADVGRSSLDELLNLFFEGSPAALVSHLLDTRALHAEQVRAIRAEVDRAMQELEDE